MEYNKNIDILKVNKKVSIVNHKMKEIIILYLKQKVFFVLMAILIFCFWGSYSILDELSRITIIITIIFFIGFYFIFKKLMNKKPKKEEDN
ncbi:hypothetical protein CO033_00410 [Candidatus Nomurabacteria bacterium CG_4_9_14_0_2_um_filter_32_10]|uniref:Uncharacterized protein n=3 Tax=Candidatus Nomuraibacteriota TaxID=1752729 RepID=A0A2H0CGS9_9BACT|nr:MAG: hypothetical protein COW91_01175 [Candidatus Nomurabacteria bacterium CG22_combo_CG10-13_8_21_14_all_32_8]PIZ85538.1 MAG: hypothetical protein COX94_02560 [Candidatus Nomurabacteria bacterium CG_4_10_14_0_2_um_filter_33_9]PJC49625.1 MAG: hypothetical protein CO033_00410 [Candidatus Nomurabacteria bacterium CG_4_9_14_0_2_um_filter_32_10]